MLVKMVASALISSAQAAAARTRYPASALSCHPPRRNPPTAAKVSVPASAPSSLRHRAAGVGRLIPYRDDFDYRNLLPPGFIVRGTATPCSAPSWAGTRCLATSTPRYRFEKAWPLLWFVVIGLIAAAVGYLYARSPRRWQLRAPAARGSPNR